MRRLFAPLIFTIALTLLPFRLTQAGTPDDSEAPIHVRAATQMIADITPANNDYVYSGSIVQWKTDAGADKYICRTDCSGFFDALLEHCYHATPELFQQWTGSHRPTAARWYESIANRKSADVLTAVSTIDAAKIGDVIVIRYQPGQQVDTGHVMIIADAPHLRDSTDPIVDGTLQWEVRVIDCSKSGHGKTDTRWKPDDETFAKGVGIGLFRLYSKPDHTIAGYSWSTLKASKFIPVADHAVMLARINPTFSAATTQPSNPSEH